MPESFTSFKLGNPKIPSPNAKNICFSSSGIGTFSFPLEIKAITKNTNKITKKYNGAILQNLDIYSLSQLNPLALPSKSFEKNKKPVTIKKALRCRTQNMNINWKAAIPKRPYVSKNTKYKSDVEKQKKLNTPLAHLLQYIYPQLKLDLEICLLKQSFQLLRKER
jgi:hypothetical protein